MVFKTTALFKDIACPYGEKCELTSCIFSHELRPRTSVGPSEEPATATNVSSAQAGLTDEPRAPPAKRRKLEYANGIDKPPSRADQIRAELAKARTGQSLPAQQSSDTPVSPPTGHEPASRAPKALPSLTKSVSPPPKNSKVDSLSHAAAGHKARPDNSNNVNNNTSTPKEALNPRLIAHDPVGHGRRSLYLKHLHGELVKLNRMVLDGETVKHKELLHLSDQEIITLALDEEEAIVKAESKIYDNKVKQRIALYRKMRVEEWVQHLKSTFGKGTQDGANQGVKPIETGLTTDEELQILPHLVAEQSSLKPYGYIPTPPTEAEAAEAAAAVEASKNYEVCDRCGARFQVFPGRDAEGKLTSNGPCQHHPSKRVYPQKTKGDAASGVLKEPYHPCCNGVVGSPGCAFGPDHVFKASSPARLAAVLPFITTPENPNPARDSCGKKVKAVTFDCEMGYTTLGLELIRLTAVSWPEGEALVDVLVKPRGVVIDLNSRFSGVTTEHYASAVPYGQQNGASIANDSAKTTLAVVENPQKARELLCSFLTPRTPLLGHAIDNDLNATRLCHPTIVDTIVLYPHPRGLPLRFGLKMLSYRHLGRNIQTGGDRGHDSFEDALATGDLVRVKVGEKWKLMSAQGWKLVEGELVPPPPSARAAMSLASGGAGTKRRKLRPGEQRGEGGSNESTEDEEVENGRGVGQYVQQMVKDDP